MISFRGYVMRGHELRRTLDKRFGFYEMRTSLESSRFHNNLSHLGTKRTPIEVSISGKSMVGFEGLWVHDNF